MKLTDENGTSNPTQLRRVDRFAANHSNPSGYFGPTG
jgi:hypothetical protein